MNFTRIQLVSSVSILLFASPAFALDGQDLLNKINNANKQSDVVLSAGAIAVDGNEVTLNDTSITLKNGTPAKIGTVKLSGVEQIATGYTIDEAVFDNVDAETSAETKSRVKLVDIKFGDIYVPNNADMRSVDNTMTIGSGGTGAFELLTADKTVASFESITTTTERNAEGGAIRSTYLINNFDIDAAGLSENPEQASATLRELGIERLTGDFEMDGNWLLSTGQLTADKFKVNLDKIGALDFKFDMSGYTADFMEELQQLSAKMGAIKDAEAEAEASGNSTEEPAQDPAQDQAQTDSDTTAEGEAVESDEAVEAGLGMLALAQRITVNSFNLRFDDDGFTKAALALYAKQNNMQPEQFAQSVKAMVPMMLAQHLPSLQKDATEAMTKFIDDPSSLTISGTPKETVPLPVLIGAGIAMPDSIVEMLSLKISAND